MQNAKATEILKECEEALKRAATDALSQGRYDEATEIVSIARAVAAFATGNAKSELPGDSASVLDVGSSGEAQVPESDSTSPEESTAAAETPKKRRKYPQFFRQASELVKIGWSKRARKEYQHRAPHRVLELLCNRLVQVGAKKKLFSTDTLFPLTDSGSNEIPSYQSYLCLAWLRHQRLVIAKGRSGYRLVKPESLLSAAEAFWNKLPGL
jgi:hypothetical protein